MAGCHRPATSELCTELQRAEALMYPHPDSALPYFMQYGDAQRKALALYYRAALYKEHKDIEKVQEFYYQAMTTPTFVVSWYRWTASIATKETSS